MPPETHAAQHHRLSLGIHELRPLDGQLTMSLDNRRRLRPGGTSDDRDEHEDRHYALHLNTPRAD